MLSSHQPGKPNSWFWLFIISEKVSLLLLVLSSNNGIFSAHLDSAHPQPALLLGQVGCLVGDSDPYPSGMWPPDTLPFLCYSTHPFIVTGTEYWNTVQWITCMLLFFPLCSSSPPPRDDWSQVFLFMLAGLLIGEQWAWDNHSFKFNKILSAFPDGNTLPLDPRTHSGRDWKPKFPKWVTEGHMKQQQLLSPLEFQTNTFLYQGHSTI